MGCLIEDEARGYFGYILKPTCTFTLSSRQETAEVDRVSGQARNYGRVHESDGSRDRDHIYSSLDRPPDQPVARIADAGSACVGDYGDRLPFTQLLREFVGTLSLVVLVIADEFVAD